MYIWMALLYMGLAPMVYFLGTGDVQCIRSHWCLGMYGLVFCMYLYKAHFWSRYAARRCENRPLL